LLCFEEKKYEIVRKFGDFFLRKYIFKCNTQLVEYNMREPKAKLKEILLIFGSVCNVESLDVTKI
jgi:hypothetical protein